MPLPEPDLIRAVLLFATPLLVAAIGELIVERAGIVNIGVEGMMLMGAAAAWMANATAGPSLGVMAGVVGGACLAGLFAGVVLLAGADQIVTGTGINLLSLGLTGLIYRAAQARIAHGGLTMLEPMWMTAAATVLVATVWVFLARTRAGLELASIGESPHAADTAGVPVNLRKLYAVLFGGACAGLAGAYLSTMRVGGFTENMTEGQGFLALAIVILGRWHPVGVLAGGLLFGLVRAYADRLIVGGRYPADVAGLFGILPYAVSLVALAGVAGRPRAPAALGRPFVRG